MRGSHDKESGTNNFYRRLTEVKLIGRTLKPDDGPPNHAEIEILFIQRADSHQLAVQLVRRIRKQESLGHASCTSLATVEYSETGNNNDDGHYCGNEKEYGMVHQDYVEARDRTYCAALGSNITFARIHANHLLSME